MSMDGSEAAAMRGAWPHWERQIEKARREGMIEGLRLAVEAVATDDPKDAWAELSIRAEIERRKAEG